MTSNGHISFVFAISVLSLMRKLHYSTTVIPSSAIEVKADMSLNQTIFCFWPSAEKLHMLNSLVRKNSRTAKVQSIRYALHSAAYGLNNMLIYSVISIA
jgi:hypothetical protein